MSNETERLRRMEAENKVLRDRVEALENNFGPCPRCGTKMVKTAITAPKGGCPNSLCRNWFFRDMDIAYGD